MVKREDYHHCTDRSVSSANEARRSGSTGAREKQEKGDLRKRKGKKERAKQPAQTPLDHAVKMETNFGMKTAGI